MPRQIIVLGIHRSGTSSVAGMLHHLGLFMGYELIPPRPENLRGFFEDLDFVHLNERLIDDWRKPNENFGRLDSVLYRPHVLRRDREFAQWGCKDPRFCLTLPLLMPHLTDPRLLVVSRPLEASIQSMARVYAGMLGENGVERAREIQTHYRNSLEKRCAEYQHVPQLHIEFDSVVNETNQTVEKISEFIFDGLAPPVSLQPAIDFIDPKFVRHGS